MPYRSEKDREYKLQYGKELRAYRKSIGLCTRCGKEKIAANSKSSCVSCLELRRKNVERKERQLTPEEKQERKERRQVLHAQRVAQRKSQGLCTDCGKPVYNGHTRCIDHYLYYRRKTSEHYAKKKKGYRELGLCIICGGECVPGKKYCQEHYQEKVEQIMKNSGKGMFEKV